MSVRVWGPSAEAPGGVCGGGLRGPMLQCSTGGQTPARQWRWPRWKQCGGQCSRASGRTGLGDHGLLLIPGRGMTQRYTIELAVPYPAWVLRVRHGGSYRICGSGLEGCKQAVRYSGPERAAEPEAGTAVGGMPSRPEGIEEGKGMAKTFEESRESWDLGGQAPAVNYRPANCSGWNAVPKSELTLSRNSGTGAVTSPQFMWRASK